MTFLLIFLGVSFGVYLVMQAICAASVYSVYGCSWLVAAGFKEEVFISRSNLIYWKGRNFLASSPKLASTFTDLHDAPISFEDAVEYLRDYKKVPTSKIPNYGYYERSVGVGKPTITDFLVHPVVGQSTYVKLCECSLDELKNCLSMIDNEVANLEEKHQSVQTTDQIGVLYDWYRVIYDHVMKKSHDA